MTLEKLNAQFEPVYWANPDAVESFMQETADLICTAMDRQTGVYSYDLLFDEVRPAMPSGADVGISPALADGILWLLIQRTVELRSRFLPDAEHELEMLNRITETMQRHGFKTAGEAIAYLHKQQIN